MNIPARGALSFAERAEFDFEFGKVAGQGARKGKALPDLWIDAEEKLTMSKWSPGLGEVRKEEVPTME